MYVMDMGCSETETVCCHYSRDCNQMSGKLNFIVLKCILVCIETKTVCCYHFRDCNQLLGKFHVIELKCILEFI